MGATKAAAATGAARASCTTSADAAYAADAADAADDAHALPGANPVAADSEHMELLRSGATVSRREENPHVRAGCVRMHGGAHLCLHGALPFDGQDK